MTLQRDAAWKCEALGLILLLREEEEEEKVKNGPPYSSMQPEISTMENGSDTTTLVASIALLHRLQRPGFSG